ncbi:RNA-binding protein 34-like [Glycine soja]|uniref:RNA-binding protein 34 n=2 Tax=Glycine soja TaxID=3848 RepID=A0A445LXK5_GLYSO|nr:RNA-binding protein 34-like [Glycine soja]RZC28014.1 RNA-binding protein 34 [Glycine soja]
MGKKKQKNPQQSSETDAVSTPSSIFSKLFANAPEQTTATAAASLFSDDNPFRRKSAPLSYSTNRTQNPNNGDHPVNTDSSEEKKRKRTKDKTSAPAPDTVSVIEALEEPEKKRKRDSDEGKDLSVGAEAIGKRKRKRDEVEKEWEEKKYGAVEEGIENKTVGIKRKTLDDPADMMVSKEGFDDEDKLLRTVFVGNLPLKVKKKTLLKEFKKFGEVESVRIRSVPIQDTKKPRKGAILAKKINDAADSVHAYIVFKTEQSAQASLAHNMSLVEGNHIRVDRACPPRKKHKGESTPLYDNKRTVFVGNLPFDVKDEELYKLFCGISNLESSIEAIRVVRDPHLNVGKGIAYVLFKTKEAAKFVVKKRNLKLRDRELRLCHAKADATPSKRPNPSSAHAPSTPAKRPNPSAHAPSTPAKKFSVASRSPSSSNNMSKSNRKTNTSYQGLRATKSDVHNKIQGGEKPKERKTKRPSVAARKAKANLVKESDLPKQAGMKRKVDSRTPDSTLRNRKVKKNR